MGLPNEVQVGRLNSVLHKLLSMKEGAPAPVLMPEILPGLILEADRPEYHFLGGGRLGIGGDSQTGGVATFAVVALENPAESGTLVVIEGYRLSADPAASPVVFLQFSQSTAGLANSNRAVHRDLRNATTLTGNAGLSARVMSGLLAAYPGVGNFVVVHRPLATTQEFALRLVLPPGFNVGFIHTAFSSNITADFLWYERALEPSELR